jgi:hypothetical protein
VAQIACLCQKSIFCIGLSSFIVSISRRQAKKAMLERPKNDTEINTENDHAKYDDKQSGRNGE